MTTTASYREVPNLPLLVVSIMLATLMQVIDSTIANVALPDMQGSLSATQDQAAWILTSYIVAAAILTPATGWLAAQFGRRHLLIVAISGFAVASVLCAMATSITAMVGFRVLQGIFGAALVPISQSSLLDAFPPEKHGAAMAMWGMGIMVGPIVGPPLGGWLTENYSWHWVFLINVPVAIVALLGVMASVPKDETHSTRFDWRGFAFLAIGIAALQLMLDRGNEKDWFSAAEIKIDLALTFLGFYLYWVHWRSRARSFVDLSLLKDRNFGVATLFIFVIGVLLFANMALMPPYLQNLMKYPVVTTGLLLAPRGVGTLISMTIIGRLLQRGIDPRKPMAIGILLIALSLGMSAQFGPDVPMWPIINVGIIQGLGLGLVFVPVSTLAYATLPGSARTEAAGIFSLSRNIGSSVGISIMFSLVARYTQINHAEIASRITPYSLNLPAGVLDIHSAQGLAVLNAEVTRQAAAIAYINDFWLMMWMTLVALPFLLLFRIPRRKGPVALATVPVAEH